ncbi:MAG: S8 family serine peptidase [Candidatus Cloacimonadia bacterium]
MFKKFSLILGLIMIIVISALSAIDLQKGTGGLNEALAEIRSPNEYIPVMLVLKEQYDTQLLYNTVKDLPKKERREVTISTLKQFSKESQSELKSLLLKKEKEKEIKSPHFLWIRNIVFFESTLNTLKELDQRDDIDRIVYDPMVQVLPDDEPEKTTYFDGVEDDTPRLEREIAYNITQVGADKLWEEGYYGQGVVVAVLDSGVNYNHVDIKNSLWIHPDYPKYGYNFVDDSFDPMDGRWHGTHCAGTVAGDGTAGTQTGLAPYSKVMAIKVLTDGGSLDQKTYHRGLEFAIEHEADVMSISVGYYHKYDPDRATIRGIMENALSAGVIASLAAANAGASQSDYPIPDNVATPSDCPPPWLNPDQTLRGGISAVFTSGATDQEDKIVDFSSRGPVTWQDVEGYHDYPFNPGMGLIKPDISSPGYEVKSLRHDDIRGYREDSGTSMSAPTTAGAIALLISKDPGITPEKIAQYIEEAAFKKTQTKSNDYGAGRLDIAAAAAKITSETPPGAPFVSIPKDKEIEVVLETPLKWVKNRPTTSYTLYLGTDNPPTNVINGMSLEESSYLPTGLLEPDTEYFWRVDATNSFGSTEGEVWSFYTVLPVTVDFENNEFAPYEFDFTTSGQESQEWFITDEVSYAGDFSAQSGKINDGGTTRMRLATRIKEDGIISFYFKLSSEYRSDHFRFYIDNEIQGEWSGDLGWQRVYFPVTEGYKSFSWVYVKDTMNSYGEDAVWVDNITLPRHYKPTIVYLPEQLTTELDYESINLSWNIEINEDANPIEFALQGFNLYGAIGDGEVEFERINSNLIEENSYSVAVSTADNYRFYVTAVYKIRGQIVETDPSETVDCLIHPAIDMPVFSPEAGEYNEPIMVSIETEDEEVEVFYTTDNTTPSLDSTLYEEPFEIGESTVIKAISYKLGYLPSEITSAEYTIHQTNVENNVLSNIFNINLYPNPVSTASSSRGSAALNIDLSIPANLSNLDIEIYNIKGQLIRSYNLSNVSRGNHILQWDLLNNQGKEATNGIYFLKFNTDGELHHKRVMILR